MTYHNLVQPYETMFCVKRFYTPIAAASHLLGPSELPPLEPPLPAPGAVSIDGINGFADAAEAFRFRCDAWTKPSISV